MKALIVPSVTVKFNANSKNTSTIPANAIATITDKYALEQRLHLEVPKAALSRL